MPHSANWWKDRLREQPYHPAIGIDPAKRRPRHRYHGRSQPYNPETFGHRVEQPIQWDDDPAKLDDQRWDAMIHHAIARELASANPVAICGRWSADRG